MGQDKLAWVEGNVVNQRQRSLNEEITKVIVFLLQATQIHPHGVKFMNPSTEWPSIVVFIFNSIKYEFIYLDNARKE